MDNYCYEVPQEIIGWANSIGCAVTISDNEGKILYMNDRSRKTYESHGDLIGYNMMQCHSERSQALIRHMLATGETNTYTVLKNGIKKLIFQSPWRKDGKIAGMVEFSIPIPKDMPHYDRDAQNKK